MLYKRKTEFQWEPLLKELAEVSVIRQQEANNDRVNIDVGLVGVTFGRQAGATKAAMKFARENDYLVMTGFSQFRMHEYHREESRGVLLCDIREILTDKMDAIRGLKVNGIVVLNDGLQTFSRLQIVQAVQRILYERVPGIVPMVMVG